MRKIVCALHDVSLPRDRWLCVLPGWQLNVNVNENACAQEHRNRKNSNFAWTRSACAAVGVGIQNTICDDKACLSMAPW